MSRIHWCWVVVWALGCAPEAGDAPLAQRHDPVIYGDDNRLDVPVHPDPAWQAVGRDTVVALMSPRVLDTRDPDRVRVRAATLRDTQALCPDERFVDQPVAADCSGTLVGADRVLTAGHCVDGATCDDLRVVFGWHQTADGAFGQITADDIYRCVEVEAWSLDERGADLALIRLDRVAAGRTPATLRLEPEPLPRGTPLVLIGYPSGLPAKIDDGGQVVVPGGPTRFQATVDAFGGNSGSGVFSAQDGRLVGVLVAGQQDYVVDGRCRRVNRLPDARSPAESLIYPAVLLDLLCVDRPQHPLCMPVGEGWCQPCAMDVACPTGWTCRLLEGVPGQGACAVGCMGDGDCRADHACVAAACVPRPGPTLCQGGDVWQEDACGLARRRVERCPVDGPCR
ncbi:MAG: trypsin-like peptidase domain-containing protein, partial [Myxococcales bacterium]|nr:trypsin-like peptidase domain-containing protein [Myxococcales bacterium]